MTGVLLVQVAWAGIAWADARWIEGTYRNPALEDIRDLPACRHTSQ
jgi:hypothetical protein